MPKNMEAPASRGRATSCSPCDNVTKASTARRSGVEGPTLGRRAIGESATVGCTERSPLQLVAPLVARRGTHSDSTTRVSKAKPYRYIDESSMKDSGHVPPCHHVTPNLHCKRSGEYVLRRTGKVRVALKDVVPEMRQVAFSARLLDFPALHTVRGGAAPNFGGRTCSVGAGNTTRTPPLKIAGLRQSAILPCMTALFR